MGGNDHQLFLSSPDSTYSRSTSNSSSPICSPSLLNQTSTSKIKSFLISDILKPTFGHNQHHHRHHNDKTNIPLSSSSPTATNDSSSSSSNHKTQSTTADLSSGMFPAWIYCTRYSDRPSAGKDKSIFAFFSANILSRSSCPKAENLRYNRLETASNGVYKQSISTFER